MRSSSNLRSSPRAKYRVSRIAEELGARLEPLLRGRTAAEKDVIIFEESRRILIAEIQVRTLPSLSS